MLYFSCFRPNDKIEPKMLKFNDDITIATIDGILGMAGKFVILKDGEDLIKVCGLDNVAFQPDAAVTAPTA